MAEYLASIFGTEKDKYAIAKIVTYNYQTYLGIITIVFLAGLTAPFTSKSELADTGIVVHGFTISQLSVKQLYCKIYT